MMKTHEGAAAHEHSLNHALEFFSKAGSLYADSETFYGGEETALGLFQKTWIVDSLLSMKLLFWLRDCRGGAGNRSGFRACLFWLANNSPEWVEKNLHLIPAVGRWDDLRVLFRTDLCRDAASFWAEAIARKDVLAAKWADRKDLPLQRAFGVNEAGLRRLLSAIRKDHIVEAKMCENRWSEIVYEHVPSVAMSRYNNAFLRHDADRYEAYKQAVAQGKKRVHADVLFPHDCARTARAAAVCRDTKAAEMADLQFDALPNFMEGTNEQIMPLVDTSGSMNALVSRNSSITRADVAKSLALYCSAKINPKSRFYKKFIEFCHEGRFVDWSNKKFSEAVTTLFKLAAGPTQVDRALMLILKTAIQWQMPQEMLPTTLLIISDMQFHPEKESRGFDYTWAVAPETDAHVAAVMGRFTQAGYQPPKIVFWNLAGYAGSPATCKMPNTALVSGFSPAILKAVLSGEDFSPLGIMYRALQKYDVVVP